MLGFLQRFIQDDEKELLRLLALVAQKTENAVIITDKDGRTQWVNEAFERISGYSTNEMLGKKPGRVLQGPKTDADTVRRIRQKIMVEEPFTEEILNYHKDGTPYWLRLHISPVKDEAGKVERFIAIETDVTQERAQAEEREQLVNELKEKSDELVAQNEEISQNLDELAAINDTLDAQSRELQEREEKLKQLALVAEQTDNAVIISSREGLIEWVNPGFTRISGWTLEEVKGKKPGSLLQGEKTDPAAVEAIRKGLASKKPFQQEILNYHKNGTPYWLNLSISPILDEQGEVERFIAIELDVTEQRARNELLERKNKDIKESIDYAARIQGAMMPDSQVLKAGLADAFVYYQPRDILSGDFYWMVEREGYLYAAFCDATGHGVPGALMAVLGIGLLEQIMQEYRLPDVNVVLDELNERLIKAMTKRGATLADGIDMLLLRFSPDRSTLQHAAAKRPLWLLRQGEWTEQKGDRQAIGHNVLQEVKPFSLGVIKLQKGDTMYAFSDGITDQYGGNPARKLSKWRLRDALTALQGRPMQEQKLGLQAFMDDWMEGHEQLDDILLAGMRV